MLHVPLPIRTVCLLSIDVSPAGLRRLTLDVDISHNLYHGFVKNADNSAILRAVRPLTQLTELILPSKSRKAPASWPHAVTQHSPHVT
jgi:hypothetical protein